MRRRWKRVWWGTGALALGLGLALWIMSPGSRNPRRVVLPDGSTLTLKAVSFGTNHYAPPRLLNSLLRQVPSDLAAKLCLDPPQAFFTAKPQLTTWWEWRDRVARGDALVLMLEHDGVMGPVGSTPFVSVDRTAFATAWKCFPRRADSLHLHAYQVPATGPPVWVAEFRVANPARGSFPRWDPEALPISRRIDDLEFSLVGFQIELARRPPDFQWCDSPQPWATLTFNITSRDRPDPGWRTDGFVLSDATGNEIDLPGEVRSQAVPRTETRTGRRDVAGSNHVVSLLWELWLDEPVYRLRVEFVRQPDAPFPPEDLLEVKGVPVPAADGISMINVRTNLHGFEIGLLALVGEHATLPGREHDVFGQTTLEVQVPPLPDGLRFDVVRVRDEQGRPAEPRSGAGSQSHGFRIPEGARMLDLKLALTKRRVVEFLVKPEIRSR